MASKGVFQRQWSNIDKRVPLVLTNVEACSFIASKHRKQWRKVKSKYVQNRIMNNAKMFCGIIETKKKGGRGITINKLINPKRNKSEWTVKKIVRKIYSSEDSPS